MYILNEGKMSFFFVVGRGSVLEELLICCHQKFPEKHKPCRGNHPHPVPAGRARPWSLRCWPCFSD